MRALKENYIAILRIELKDLHTDIEHLIRECQDGKESGVVTEHVFVQNLSLFKNELLGVNSFEQILDELDPENFINLDEMIQEIKRLFQDTVKAHGLAPVINLLVDRKLDKVAKYVKQ